MAPPPPPIRRTDPSFSQQPPSSTPFSAHPSLSTHRPQSRLPHIPGRVDAVTRPAGAASQQASVQEEEEGHYDDTFPPSQYPRYGSTPEAQPLSSLPFTQPSQLQPPSQSQSQSSRVLVQDTAHIPRRTPRPQTAMDFRETFPLSLPSFPPARQNHPMETIIPDTPFESQSQPGGSSRPAPPPQRVDSYQPQPGFSAAYTGQTNMWEGVGHTSPAKRSGRDRPASAMVMREGRAPTPAGGGAAQLFMAATQQGGGTKTNSEKIMDALTAWSSQILGVVEEVKSDQKRTRDQVHEVKTSMKALATREEVVEEITAQLSPALHEFFQTLHAKLDSSISPVPEQAARLAAEKVRGIMAEVKQIEASQRSQEDNQEKPIIKLIDHLISKLDSVSHVSDFLEGCKELPEALRDVTIYKQSIDAITAVAKAGPGPISSAQASQVDNAILQAVKGSIDQLAQHLGQHLQNTVSAEDRVIGAINALTNGLDEFVPMIQRQPPHSTPAAPQRYLEDVTSLRVQVDTLSSDVREMKALLASLAAPRQHVSVDVGEIVAQLRASTLPPFPSTETVRAPVAHPPAAPHPSLHPPMSTPPDLDPGAEDYSQLQPTEVGTSQDQTRTYPTPTSMLRPYRSTTVESTPIIQHSANASSSKPSHPALTSNVPTPLPDLTQPATMVCKNGEFSLNTSAKSATDVFGTVQSTQPSGSRQIGPSDDQANASMVPIESGLSVVEEEDMVDHEVDDDFFDQARKARASASGKGKGKRALNGSSPAAAPSTRKRLRTQTSTPSSSTHAVARSTSTSTAGHSTKTKEGAAPKTRSTTSHPSAGAVIDCTGSSPEDYIPRGRSDRIIAKSTVSDKPIYHSEDSLERAKQARKGGARGKNGGVGSVEVKRELVDGAEAGRRAGPSGSTRAAKAGKSAAVTSPTDDHDSLNSDGYVPPQSQAALSVPGRYPPDQQASAGGNGNGSLDETLQLQSSARDPAPMAAVKRFTRNRPRFADIGLGDDEESGTL